MRLEVLFFVALVLYTFVVFSHRVKKELKVWMLIVFGTGLLADACGTIFLCALANHSWTFNFHTISGFLSLLIMTLHFFWALIAKTVSGRFETYFTRFSIYAWLLWILSFISGIPLT